MVHAAKTATTMDALILIVAALLLGFVPALYLLSRRTCTSDIRGYYSGKVVWVTGASSGLGEGLDS